ncbi:hypothetical protein CN918_31645 [Priestia megaterium]|nr:hypothetical protein CN918_31645 [Priestia megaterium]
MFLVRTIAIDCGNFNAKSKSNRGELQYCNTIREKKRFEGKNIFGKESRKIKSYKINDTEYIVGATDKDALFVTDKNGSRYETPEFKNAFLISVFKHIQVNGEVVRVVTGIPTKHYDNRETYAKAQKAFNEMVGEHTINDTSFRIESIDVELQPTATLNYLALNENGTFKLNGEKYQESTVLLLDLGMGSSDVTILANGEIADMFELNNTMLTVYKAILKRLRERAEENGMDNVLADENISPQDVEVQIRKTLEGPNKRAVFTSESGKEIDIDDIVRDEFQKKTSIMLGELRENGVVFSKYYAIVFTGGGCKTLLPYLKESLKDYRGDEEVNFKMPDDLIKANVRGYYVIGESKKKRVNQ